MSYLWILPQNTMNSIIKKTFLWALIELILICVCFSFFLFSYIWVWFALVWSFSFTNSFFLCAVLFTLCCISKFPFSLIKQVLMLLTCTQGVPSLNISQDWLSLLRVSIFLLAPFRYLLGLYLRLSHDCFLPHSIQSIIHYSCYYLML